MTYNFDPDNWYRMQLHLIEARRLKDGLDEETVSALIADLDRRYDEMLARLDGSYTIPSTRSGGSPAES